MNLLLWLKENWGILLGYALGARYINHYAWHQIYDEIPFLILGILLVELVQWTYQQRKADNGTRKDPS